MLKRGNLVLTVALLILVISPMALAGTSTLVSEDLFKVTESSSYSNTLDGNIKVSFKSISSDAAISIDNIERGYTPRQIYLTPGYHTAKLMKAGQPPVEFEFYLQANSRYTYTIRFLTAPLTSSLKVLSSSRDPNALLRCQALRGSGDFIYFWDFGDGYTETNEDSDIVYHTYYNPGSYYVQCIIYDENTGRQTQSQKTVVIRR